MKTWKSNKQMICFLVLPEGYDWTTSVQKWPSLGKWITWTRLQDACPTPQTLCWHTAPTKEKSLLAVFLCLGIKYHWPFPHWNPRSTGVLRHPMRLNSSSQQFEMHILEEMKLSAITVDVDSRSGARDGPKHSWDLVETCGSYGGRRLCKPPQTESERRLGWYSSRNNYVERNLEKGSGSP